MVSYDDTVTSLTDLKQNYAYSDDETDAQDNILREKLRMWHKITRLAFDGTETAVVLPFNTLYEPFFTEDDVDLTNTTAIYDSTNEYFRFYTDANGCYDRLTSKTISLRYNSRLKSISTTVYAKDTSGNPVTSGFDLQLYNGQEWFNIGNGTEVETIDIDGSDLDADLDADLSRRIINFDTDNTILFQNNIKYRIHYTGTDELIVYKVLIKLNFYKQIELIPGFPTIWGTWGTL